MSNDQVYVEHVFSQLKHVLSDGRHNFKKKKSEIYVYDIKF